MSPLKTPPSSAHSKFLFSGGGGTIKSSVFKSGTGRKKKSSPSLSGSFCHAHVFCNAGTIITPTVACA